MQALRTRQAVEWVEAKDRMPWEMFVCTHVGFKVNRTATGYGRSAVQPSIGKSFEREGSQRDSKGSGRVPEWRWRGTQRLAVVGAQFTVGLVFFTGWIFRY